MAVVIRTKDAGVNRLTYDIIFNPAQDDATALRANVFTKENTPRCCPSRSFTSSARSTSIPVAANPAEQAGVV